MSEYVVLLDNDNSVTITADNCEWDSDSIEFYNVEKNVVAMFKMEHIIGWFRKLQNLLQLQED